MLDACGFNDFWKWVRAINQWLDIASFLWFSLQNEAKDSSSLEDLLSQWPGISFSHIHLLAEWWCIWLSLYLRSILSLDLMGVLPWSFPHNLSFFLAERPYVNVLQNLREREWGRERNYHINEQNEDCQFVDSRRFCVSLRKREQGRNNIIYIFNSKAKQCSILVLK